MFDHPKQRLILMMKRGGYAAILILICLLSYQKAYDALAPNLAHRQLAYTLGASRTTWTEWITSTSSFGHDAQVVEDLVSSSRVEPAMSSSITECSDPNGAACDSLSAVLQAFVFWHLDHERAPLGQLFAIMSHVYHQNDTDAVQELLSMNAAGVLLDVGAVLSRQQQANRAALYLEAALTLQPTDYPVIRQLAILYLAEQRYCEMVEVSRRGVQYYPDTPLFYYYLGRAFEGLEAWQLAIDAYQQAVAKFPGYEPYEGRLLYAVQQAEKAPTVNPVDVCRQILPVNKEQ